MTSHGYTLFDKGYAKSFLYALAGHHIIHMSDVKSIKTVAYKKVHESNLICTSCFLYIVKLFDKLCLRYMRFETTKRIEYDDGHFKADVAKMLEEQYDIEDELSDIGFEKF